MPPCLNFGIGTRAGNRTTCVAVATYVEEMTQAKAAPTVKQHLAAIKMLLDSMVTGHVIETNPATSVRGPKHVVSRGKTPYLSAEDAKTLFDSIKPTDIVALRDRALIAVMVYSFARISAALGVDPTVASSTATWKQAA